MYPNQSNDSYSSENASVLCLYAYILASTQHDLHIEPSSYRKYSGRKLIDMFNYQRSFISNNIQTPNGADPALDFGWTDHGASSLAHHRHPTGGLGLGRPSNPMMPLGQPWFNQQLTEVRKTIITPRGIQIHSVVDIPAPAVRLLPRLPQSPFWGQTLALRAPLLNSQLAVRNQSFVDNVSLPPIPTLNWPPTNTASMPGVPVGQAPALDVKPIRSCPAPQLPVPNMNNWNNLANLDSLLPSSRTPMIGAKTEPDKVPEHESDGEGEDSEETEEDNHDSNDGRTHSLPHQKHGPYTCPKCNLVFQISQSFASHVLGHYKHETAAERRRRYIAKYKKKGLQLTQSSHGLTVAHKSFKENRHEVGRLKKNPNQGTVRCEFAAVENKGDEPPQLDLRKPSTSSSGSIVRVKEELND